MEPVRLLESRGITVEKRNVQKITRADLENLSALFPSDDEFLQVFVHERKREGAAGLSRTEILDRMEQDYTWINRPVIVSGKKIACGPLKLNRERYDRLFGGA